MEQSGLHRKISPLGYYLSQHAYGATIIDRALRAQEELRRQGIYKPFGQIVAESGDVERALLEDCLQQQRADVLAQVSLFSSLPRETLVRLASAIENVILPPGGTVYRADDPGNKFYVVASGGVTVSRNENGMEITIAVREPGEGFGEIALLTGRPHSTTATTPERTSIILIPRELFLETVFSHPGTAQACATILAERLGRGYTQIVDVAVTGESYRQFLSEELRQDEQLLIGMSPAIQKIIGQIEELAATELPVLVQGEPGSEMRAVAALFPLITEGEPGLLLEMDAKAMVCARDGPEQDSLVMELMQAGSLFGRGYNALPFAPERRPGLLTMARNGTVVIGNVEHLSRRVQESLADVIETGEFLPVGEQQRLPSTARIIATSSADLHALAGAGDFDRRLYGLFAERIVTVPPLRRRKQDLRMMVDELIKQGSRQLNKHIRGIADDAYQSLMTYDWPGNAEELGLVIRRAISINQSGTLSQEDLFIGPPPVTGRFTLNLLQYAPVRRFLQSRFYPDAVLYLSVPFVILIVALGLFGPQSPERNAVLALTWGIWEPLVIMSTFIASRAWCSACPIGALNRTFSKRVGLNLKVPPFIRENGFYLAGMAIATIFWTEAASVMSRSPRATAILLLSIICLGAVFGLVFQRRAWCRYACGLGGMVGALSTCSAIELRSNYGICNTTCKTHECYTGTDRYDGCQMFQGPFSLSSNLNCDLCGSCVKSCGNQAPVLNLRLPAYDIWAQSAPDRAVAVLALFLIGTQLFRSAWYAGLSGTFSEGSIGIWMGSLFLMGLGVLLAGGYAKLAGNAVFKKPAVGADDRIYRLVYVLIPLCFSYEVAFQLKRFLVMTGQLLPVLGRQLGIAGELPGFSASSVTIKVLQVLLVGIGTAGSLGVLAKQARADADGSPPAPACRRTWPVLLFAAAYAAAFLAVAP